MKNLPLLCNRYKVQIKFLQKIYKLKYMKFILMKQTNSIFRYFTIYLFLLLFKTNFITKDYGVQNTI